MRRYFVYGVTILSMVISFAIPASSQEEVAMPTPETVASEELSIYGEVQAVNAESNLLTVQYYDYDSDEEKTIDILADKNTKVENATGLSDVKKGDWVDATYTVSDSKNVAKSIIVEKEEEETLDETAPELAPAELPED